MTIYQSFKLTPEGDLAIENGDFVLIEDEEVIRQQLEINYKLAKRNWFLNLDEGLNFFDNENGIIGNKTLSDENRAEMIEIGTNTVGVKELINFDAQIDSEGVLTVILKSVTIFSEEPQEITIEV